MEAPPSSRQVLLPWSDPALQLEQPWSRRLQPLIVRWPLLVGIVAGTMLLVTGATLMAPKRYTTTAKLMVGNSTNTAASDRDPQTVLPLLNSLLAMNGQQSAETYAELLHETPVAEQVIANLRLATTPRALLDDVSVKPVTNTAIIRLSATARTPAQSATIANEFAHVFVERERRLVANQADEALTFLQAQLPVAERRMRVAQSRVAAYEAANGMPDIAAQTQSLLTQVGALDSKIGQVQLDEKQAEAQSAAVEGHIAQLPSTITSASSTITNPVLSQLESQRAQLEVQLRSARMTYTDEHPTVIALQQQLREVDNEITQLPKTIVASRNTTSNPVRDQLEQLAAGYQAAARAAQAQIGELRAQRAALDPALHRLPAQTNRVAELKRNARHAEDVFNELQRKNTEASVAKTTALSDVTVIAPAVAGDATKLPNVLLSVLIGTMVGIILAATAAYAIDFFDSTVKDEHEVSMHFGLPVLASIPLAPGARAGLPGAGRPPEAVRAASSLAALTRAPVEADEQAVGSAARLARRLSIDAFVQLVTSLRYATDKPVRTICVTSALAGEGKSTVAVNAAIALAEMQPRVLLVDGDMRRPTVHSGLRVPKDMGLSDVLAGTSVLEKVIQRSPHAGLDVVTSGTATPNPLKLLQSDRLGQMLVDAQRTYTTVIIDGPALNLVFDGAIIATKTDGAVLVVSAGETEVRQTKRALSRLASVGVGSVLGVVVNRARGDFMSHNPYYRDAYEDEVAFVPSASDA